MENITTRDFYISTFNDGVNNIYRTLEIERWFDIEHGDYVFTFNREVEHISKNASFDNILKLVFGNKLLDCKEIKF